MKKYLFYTLPVYVLLSFLFIPLIHAKETKSAKASFESGGGVGISYRIELIAPDGKSKIVPSTHTFKSGDKIKVHVKANKAGYLTVMNIGSSGMTHVLFNDMVDSTDVIEIPKKNALRFVGQPGTEKLLIMLSANPNPFALQAKKGEQQTPAAPQSVAVPPQQAPQAPAQPQQAPAKAAPSKKTAPQQAAAPQAPAQPQQAAAPEMPPPDPESSLVPPLPMLLASLEGSKDIVLEDDLDTNYVVLSPKDGFKPVKLSATAMAVESKGGINYGVVPSSVLDKGQILTLEIKLKHK